MPNYLSRNGKMLVINGGFLSRPAVADPYNPLGLPPFTIRCKFAQGFIPTGSYGDSQTLVDATENVWDITKNSTNWNEMFSYCSGILEVLGANTTGVTGMGALFMNCGYLTNVQIFDTRSCRNMSYMFCEATSLTTVPLFDTSNVVNMEGTFEGCLSLSAIPLFDTSSCYRMTWTFHDCRSVQSGALALYQQASTQDTVPIHSTNTFRNCGRDTTTGLAELQQIPESWGGLAPD